MAGGEGGEVCSSLCCGLTPRSRGLQASWHARACQQARRHAARACSARREPQPRRRTRLAGGLPSATRCALSGWPSSTRRMHSLSSFTTAAVCAASGEPSSGSAACARVEGGACSARDGAASHHLAPATHSYPPTQPPSIPAALSLRLTSSGRLSLRGSVPLIWSLRPGPRTTTPQRCSVAYSTLTACCERGRGRQVSAGFGTRGAGRLRQEQQAGSSQHTPGGRRAGGDRRGRRRARAPGRQTACGRGEL